MTPPNDRSRPKAAPTDSTAIKSESHSTAPERVWQAVNAGSRRDVLLTLTASPDDWVTHWGEFDHFDDPALRASERCQMLGPVAFGLVALNVNHYIEQDEYADKLLDGSFDADVFNAAADIAEMVEAVEPGALRVFGSMLTNLADRLEVAA